MTTSAPATVDGTSGSPHHGVDPTLLQQLHQREVERFVAERPASRALHEQAAAHLLGGVPMSWMSKWPGPFPVYVERAQGAHFTCADGTGSS